VSPAKTDEPIDMPFGMRPFCQITLTTSSFTKKAKDQLATYNASTAK